MMMMCKKINCDFLNDHTLQPCMCHTVHTNCDFLNNHTCDLAYVIFWSIHIAVYFGLHFQGHTQ